MSGDFPIDRGTDKNLLNEVFRWRKKMLVASGERREIFFRCFEDGEMNFLTMPTPEIQS